MVTGNNNSRLSVCEQLKAAAAALGQQIAISEANEKKRQTYSDKLRIAKEEVNLFKQVQDEVQAIITEAETYLGERSKRGNMAINAALLSARNVVPDAMSGVRMAIDGKEMWLENEDGMLVERMEGGGFRACCSLFCRKVALASNPSTMQFLVLDELLAKLSPESSVTISQYLPIIAKDMQILIIEQKKEVYAQADCTRYNFFLAEGKTIVEREVIHGDAETGGSV